MTHTQESYFKSDITRLKNLLLEYRDHMITRLIERSKVEPTRAINCIDSAIDRIKMNL